MCASVNLTSMRVCLRDLDESSCASVILTSVRVCLRDLDECACVLGRPSISVFGNYIPDGRVLAGGDAVVSTGRVWRGCADVLLTRMWAISGINDD